MKDLEKNVSVRMTASWAMGAYSARSSPLAMTSNSLQGTSTFNFDAPHGVFNFVGGNQTTNVYPPGQCRDVK